MHHGGSPKYRLIGEDQASEPFPFGIDHGHSQKAFRFPTPMTSIQKIRNGLRRIDGALGSFPPEESHRGAEGAVQTLWNDHSTRRDNYLEAVMGPPANPIHDDESDDSDDDFKHNDFTPVFEIGPESEELQKALAGDEGERIKQSVLITGVDALGWYMPFHYTGAQWGAYISTSGIAYMIANCLAKLPTSFEVKARLAFNAILNHELFHFATEYTIAQAEITQHEPWFLPAGKFKRTLTPKYFTAEECLANAYMLRRFRSSGSSSRIKGKQAALRAFVKEQPEGYRDGILVNDANQNNWLGKLAHDYGRNASFSKDHAALWDSNLGYDWANQFPIHPAIDWRFCPIHLVHDAHRLGLPADWLSCFSRLTCIRESSHFEKKLSSLSRIIQSAWGRTKTKLETAITAGADFKKWPKAGPNFYSVRLNDGYRAHLEYVRDEGFWLARAIGNHKEMGHG